MPNATLRAGTALAPRMTPGKREKITADVSWTPFESQMEWNFNWGRFGIKVSEARTSIDVAKTESLGNWRSGGGIV